MRVLRWQQLGIRTRTDGQYTEIITNWSDWEQEKRGVIMVWDERKRLPSPLMDTQVLALPPNYSAID